MNQYEIAAAVDLAERELPEFSWSISRIRNPHHSARPYGEGISVHLVGYVEDVGEIQVWEKHPTNSHEAMAIAIKRARRRIAGETGA